MATAKDIAVTVDQLADELARRIDELRAEGEITSGAAASLTGIVEWAGSIKTALDECNGIPAATSPAALYRQDVESRLAGCPRVDLTAYQAEAVRRAIAALDGLDADDAPGLLPDPAGDGTAFHLYLSPVRSVNDRLLARLDYQYSHRLAPADAQTGPRPQLASRYAAQRIRRRQLVRPKPPTPK